MNNNEETTPKPRLWSEVIDELLECVEQEDRYWSVPPEFHPGDYTRFGILMATIQNLKAAKEGIEEFEKLYKTEYLCEFE